MALNKTAKKHGTQMDGEISYSCRLRISNKSNWNIDSTTKRFKCSFEECQSFYLGQLSLCANQAEFYIKILKFTDKDWAMLKSIVN